MLVMENPRFTFLLNTLGRGCGVDARGQLYRLWPEVYHALVLKEI